MKAARRGIGLLVLLVGFAFGQITLAQEAVDPAALQEIASAFTNTQAVSSLHIVSQSLTESTGGADGQSLSTQQTQEFDVSKTEAGWNMQGSTTTNTSMPFGAFELTSETVIVDGVTYVRFGELPQGMPLELPTDWVDLEAFAAELGNANGVPAGQGLPFGAATDQLLDTLLLPINTESVTQITALPADQINGQAMRVYQVTLDSAVMLENEAFDFAAFGQMGGFGGGFGGGVPDNFTPPAGAPELPAAGELTLPTPEEIQMTFAIYIGEEDGLVHRVYLVITVAASGDAENPGLGLTLTRVNDYSKFNEIVEISAPISTPE